MTAAIVVGTQSSSLAKPISPQNASLVFNVKEISRDTTETTNQLWNVKLSSITTATGKSAAPFWLRVNRFGDAPTEWLSTGLIPKIEKRYNEKGQPFFDWGLGLEGRFAVGRKSQAILIESYIKGKAGIFELRVGRSRDLMGLVDSTLSAGAFSISGNALGVPKVELSIPEFWALPILNRAISVKGNFSYGWFGKTPLNYYFTKISSVDSYLHQKSLYLRLAPQHWRLSLSAGFNHQVMWGNEKKLFGDKYTLSPFKSYLYAITGGSVGGGGSGLPRSRVGNHIGSLDASIGYDFGSTSINIYRQFYYEVGGLYHLNNIKDGLWGFSIANRAYKGGSGWKKFLFEVLYSKSQGGEEDAKVTPSGDENYYNNYVYAEGWSYKNANIGNALFTNRLDLRPGQVVIPTEFVSNNRLFAFHIGQEGVVRNVNFVYKLTYSKNYGTYASSPIGTSLGGTRKVYGPPFFDEVDQFSGLVEVNKNLNKSVNIGAAVAGDYGDLLHKSAGFYFKVTKSFIN